MLFVCRLELTIDPLDFSNICIFPLKKPSDTGPNLLDVFHHLLTLPLRNQANRINKLESLMLTCRKEQ